MCVSVLLRPNCGHQTLLHVCLTSGHMQAIIVDAFCEVKESTSSSSSILQDLSNTLRIRSADVQAFTRSLLWWGPRTSLTTSETGKLLKLACTTASSADEQSKALEPQTALGADKRVLQLGQAKLSRQDVAAVLHAQRNNLEAAWKKQPGTRSDMQHDLQKLSYWIFERFSEEDKSQHNAEYQFPELDFAAESEAEAPSGHDVRPQRMCVRR